MYRRIFTLFFLYVLAQGAPSPAPLQTAEIGGANIKIEFDRLMHSRVIARFAGREIAIGPAAAAEFIVVNGRPIQDFSLQSQRFATISDARGAGQQLVITGLSGVLEKTEIVESFKDYPRMLFIRVQYANTGQADLSIDGWTNCSYSLNANPRQMAPAFWSLESGSHESRPDWVVPLRVGFHQQNYLGMNASDYGGGHSRSRCLASGRGARSRPR
jgi:alpha-galactosidase